MLAGVAVRIALLGDRAGTADAIADAATVRAERAAAAFAQSDADRESYA